VSDDEDSIGRWALSALQITAMALCACIVAEMYVEQTFRMPTHACVDLGPPGLAESTTPIP